MWRVLFSLIGFWTCFLFLYSTFTDLWPYVTMEVEPYENGDERVMEERETCSGWERESREKNIPIVEIRDRYGML